VLDGSLPTVEDVARGRFIAVLNRSTAKKLFGDARAVGQSIDVGGQSFQVIGVVEDAIHINAFADLWVPVSTDPSSDYRSQMWGDYTALILAREPDDIRAIQVEVARLARTVKYDDPKEFNQAFFWADGKLDFFARQLLGTHRQEDSGKWLLLAVIGTLMLLFMALPALNLVNLNTGRILERSRRSACARPSAPPAASWCGSSWSRTCCCAWSAACWAWPSRSGAGVARKAPGLIPYLHVN
jgi:putative ABC transport system permease protein